MKSKLPKLADNERKALFELKKRLKEKFGDKLKRIILYGSKARGDSDPGSDIDVLIEFSETDRETNDTVSHIAFSVGLEYDVLIVDTVHTTAELEKRKKVWMPFIENVIKDGVLI
jgi:predicted nucleotidyltransferase